MNKDANIDEVILVNEDYIELAIMKSIKIPVYG